VIELLKDVAAGTILILLAVALVFGLHFSWSHGVHWPIWALLAVFAVFMAGTLGFALRNR
jgi:hypothetical protein